MTISRTKKAKLKLTLPDKCWYCGKGKPSTIDHVKPISKGGGNEIDNLVLCCKSCNSTKKDGTIGELRFKRSWNKTRFSQDISATVAKKLMDKGVVFDGFINDHEFWFEGIK